LGCGGAGGGRSDDVVEEWRVVSRSSGLGARWERERERERERGVSIVVWREGEGQEEEVIDKTKQREVKIDR